MSTSYPRFLVETDWLENHLDDPALRILDCSAFVRSTDSGYRFQSGLDDWKRAHIPGAVFADLTLDLSDQDSRIPFMIPGAGKFSDAMSRLGVQKGVFVVLYDSFINIWAARVWWMLQAFGFEHAAILNGGWKKWKREKRPISSDPDAYPPGEFFGTPKPEMIATKADVLEGIEDDETVIIDALTRQEYAGDLAVYGRAGHIPTSINVPAIELVDRRSRAYLPLGQLEKIFAPVLAHTPRKLITYCGGGAAGSSAAFTLKRLGVAHVAVYDGALLEWAQDPDLAMETGASNRD